MDSGHEGLAHQRAGTPVARGIFVYQEAHFGWQVGEHVENLWGVRKRYEEKRLGIQRVRIFQVG